MGSWNKLGLIAWSKLSSSNRDESDRTVLHPEKSASLQAELIHLTCINHQSTAPGWTTMTTNSNLHQVCFNSPPHV